MYKKAARLKLRFESDYGPLTVEQLYDLKPKVLKSMIKKLYKEKEELGTTDDTLNFLEDFEGLSEKEVKKNEEVNLKFDILKDVWNTIKEETKSTMESTKKRMEINRLESILAEKKEQDLRNLSTE